MNYEPTKQQKIDSIEIKLKNVYKSIYDLTVEERVAKKIDDDAMKKRIVAELTKMEKAKDEYEAILKEVKSEK